jgi:hypothetical protein
MTIRAGRLVVGSASPLWGGKHFALREMRVGEYCSDQPHPKALHVFDSRQGGGPVPAMTAAGDIHGQ